MNGQIPNNYYAIILTQIFYKLFYSWKVPTHISKNLTNVKYKVINPFTATLFTCLVQQCSIKCHKTDMPHTTPTSSGCNPLAETIQNLSARQHPSTPYTDSSLFSLRTSSGTKGTVHIVIQYTYIKNLSSQVHYVSVNAAPLQNSLRFNCFISVLKVIKVFTQTISGGRLFQMSTILLAQ